VGEWWRDTDERTPIERVIHDDVRLDMTGDQTLEACQPLSDAAVLRASREEPELFAVVYDRYAEQLFQYAQRRLGPDAAQDVVAETFLAAFRGRGRYEDAWPVARPWLFGILVREIARPSGGAGLSQGRDSRSS
jgi:hypothetical protein